MTDGQTGDTDTTDASEDDETHLEAVRSAVDTLLRDVRRAIGRSTATATESQPSPVLIADGGQDNAKIIGHNKSNGQTVGVWGEVDSDDGCGFATPDDVRIDGTIDTNGTDFTVDAGTTTTDDARNVILGHASNEVTDGVVAASIAGGGRDDGSTDESHVVHDNYGTVGGGGNNQAGSNDADTSSNEYATVGGGKNNTASAQHATVGGGNSNTASGVAAVVPGGRYGAAESDFSFVWNDGTRHHEIPNTNAKGLSSDTSIRDSAEPTGANTFSVSATGGVRFATDGGVTYIEADSTGWSNTSTRAAKTNIDPVDPQQVLDGVEDVEVATWEYKNDDGDGAGTTHVGPMAEEFHGILDVDLGSSDKHINSLNADGILFAAVQGLAERLNEETDRLAEENEQLERDLDAKEDRIEELEAENDELRERLADIEAHLGFDGASDPAPADD